MGPHPSDIANSLSQKYQALHDAFNALALDAAQFQNSISLTDPSQRGLFNSLSRIVAFSDHVHVALNLMAEDVRAIETTYGETTTTGAGWAELDDNFDEWFTKMSPANAKVH
jgi:uncharacterized phage infection (PIP) family protein YhgE